MSTISSAIVVLDFVLVFFFVFGIFSGSLIKKSLPELGLKNGYIKLMQNVSSSNQKQRLKQSEPCQEREIEERERASERRSEEI